MSKMDRQGARTAADLEQKYQFGKRFAEIMGVALDAQKAITAVGSELRTKIEEQYTSIMRDTEKIVMEAGAKYVKDSDYEEYKKEVSAQLKVMADELSASLQSTTEQITSFSNTISSFETEVSATIESANQAVAGVEKDIKELGDALTEYSEASESFKKTVTEELTSAVERITATESGITATDEKVDGVDADLKTVKEELELHYVANAEFKEYCEAEISATSQQVALNMESTTESFTEVLATLEDTKGEIQEQHTFTEELREYCESEFAASAKNLELKFQSTTEQITNVDGNVKSISDSLEKYFEFGTDGLTIRSGESEMKLRIDNDMISFYKGDIDENDLAKNRFGWWDGVNFYTGNIFIEVEERAQLGNFAFVPRSNGSLDFLKVGG